MYELQIYSRVICHDNEEWCKIWRGVDLVFQNWHQEFDKFWFQHSKVLKICTLMDFFWQNYIMFELKKYRGVTFDGTEDWCKIWRKTDLCFQKWHEERANFHRLKNSDFILKSKMVKLNQNQNSKQPDRPDTVSKLYFTLEINE